MAAFPASRFGSLGFGVLGVAISVAGLAAVAAGFLNASVTDSRPDGIGGFAKGSPAALRHGLTAELALEKGQTIATRHTDQAERLLAAAPLDPAALTYLGLAADAKGNAGRAQALMTLALRSEGRQVRTRLWIMDHDLRRRDYSGAIDHFDQLVKISPPLTLGLVAAMTGIVRDPASHAPLARKLATNPSWRPYFLSALNDQHVSPDIIYRLTPQNSGKTQGLSEQAALLRSLLKGGEYERAYLAWINFLPESSLKQLGPVYDPQFQNLPGPLPLNWQLYNGADGATEFRSPKGLTVSYLGTAPAGLAEQTLLLSAGHYRLSVIASGSDDNNQLAWTMTCSGSNQALSTVSLKGLKASPQRYATAFDVPPGCGSQRLALAGSPGEFPRAADAEVDAVLIEAVK